MRRTALFILLSLAFVIAAAVIFGPGLINKAVFTEVRRTTTERLSLDEASTIVSKYLPKSSKEFTVVRASMLTTGNGSMLYNISVDYKSSNASDIMDLVERLDGVTVDRVLGSAKVDDAQVFFEEQGSKVALIKIAND